MSFIDGISMAQKLMKTSPGDPKKQNLLAFLEFGRMKQDRAEREDFER